jgi:hypothetical protein
VPMAPLPITTGYGPCADETNTRSIGSDINDRLPTEITLG